MKHEPQEVKLPDSRVIWRKTKYSAEALYITFEFRHLKYSFFFLRLQIVFMMLTDRERQQDEVYVLQNIYDSLEFKCWKKKNIECEFSINCKLMKEQLQIKCERQSLDTKNKQYIRHLPPIHLFVQLPANYPSAKAPSYHLFGRWLPPWGASLICQRLDEIWQENKYSEILYIWLEFLKNEALPYIGVEDTLDVSYLWDLFENPTDDFLCEMLNEEWTDQRVINGGLYSNPLDKLIDYSNLKDSIDFETNSHECGICFGEYCGKNCEKINPCCHIFCKYCLTEFLSVRIKDRNVNNLQCPATGCKVNIDSDQIKKICSENLFHEYEKYLLEYKLMSNGNLVHCPRKQCQSLVELKEGENLASCLVCEYNFCAYCLKVYHGVVPCDMDSKDKIKLIEEYQNGDAKTKKNLEKQYGKIQIREIVEKKLTNDYLKENTKTCPTCNVIVTKIDGCNLMKCARCQSNFCWLCNTKIVSEDPYDHFKYTTEGLCNGRLFEGLTDNIDNEFDDMLDELDFDLINNLELFIDQNDNANTCLLYKK